MILENANKVNIKVTIIIIYLNIGCAGSILNPVVEDYYGQAKHIKNDVIILVNVSSVDSIKNAYAFEFYEPVIATDPIRKNTREQNIKKYYNRFRDENGFGSYYQIIRSLKRTRNPLKYNNIIIYTDSSELKYKRKVPGLIKFEELIDEKSFKF